MPHSSFDYYRQEMQHEFEAIEESIKKVGYKVDSDMGIKIHCKCSELKSVDYFHEHGGRLSLVEFSDLARQHEQIIRRVNALKDSNLEKKDIRDFVKKLYKTIPDEMRNKYLSSIHILKIMQEKLKDIPEWAVSSKGKYFIIVAPLLQAAPAEKRADVARLLDKIQNDLTTSIPDDLFSGVSVVQLSSFLQQ